YPARTHTHARARTTLALPASPRSALRLFVSSVGALPAAGRLWWIGAIVVALAVLPWCFIVEQPFLPLPVMALVALINAALVVVTAYRRRRDNLAPSFDYGGVTTITVLVLAGPAA